MKKKVNKGMNALVAIAVSLAIECTGQWGLDGWVCVALCHVLPDVTLRSSEQLNIK